MSNFVQVNMPTNQVQFKRVYRAQLKQQNYEHDYARIYFRDWGLSPKQAKPGTPISFKIDGKEFFGYIHDIKNVQETGKHFTEVGIIGASYVMRQASQQVYKNMTADQVVVKIAKKYGFAYKVVPHKRVYPQIAQAGMTDWELMVKLAKQCGYFLRAENTSLYFQPLLQDFEELIYESRRFVKNDAGFKDFYPLYTFKPMVGETLAHHGADKSATSIAGIDPLSGKFFKYTTQKRSETTRSISQPELFDRHATDVVVNSYTAAVSEAASADDKSRFPYFAEAEVIGTIKLRPGMPVYLDGIGDEYSGYWTVLRVDHYVVETELNKQRFTTRIAVGTDALGAVADQKYPIRPPVKPIRKITANIKNTKIIANTIIKATGVQVKPSGSSALVDRINRADIPAKNLRKNVWVSTQGNLTSKPTPPSKSKAARDKARAHSARN